MLLLGARAASYGLQGAAPATAQHARRCSRQLRRVATRVRATATVEATPAAEDAPPAMASMDEIVNLCKRRGLIFQSSEVYGGFAGFYDYGPLGAELKKNVKDAWWRNFVTRREDVVGLDSSIIHNPTTWQSSGESNCSNQLYTVSYFST